ncbi:hypothetical protein ScPMuIL_010389 [Solemya velum]
MKPIVCVVVFGILGVALIAVGGGLIPVFTNLIHNNVKDKVKIQNGTDTYDKWLSPPYPVYFQVWAYDVLNPSDIVQGKKPVVAEKGPYTYKEERHKVNVTFYPNGTVSYREIRWFTFDRERSIGSDDDIITTVSVPMVSIVNLIRFQFSFVKELVNFVLKMAGEPLFMKLSVKQLMWGYEDQLLKDAKELLEKYVGKIIDDKFGLFMAANNSDDGMYTIHTGVDDTNKFGIVDNWNGNSTLHFWTTDSCNKINGTDGTVFPPFVDKSDKLFIFSTDICRSIFTSFSKEYELKGVNVYRFSAPDSVFANYTANPANTGFCTPKGNCLGSGVLNVSICQPMNAPVILSQPHFHAASPKIKNAIDGIQDTPEDVTILDVEPLTGALFKADKKMQMNVFLENVSHITDMALLDDLIFPIIWLNESTLIDDADVDTFKSEVEKPIKITKGVQYGLMALGAFVLICTIIYAVRKGMGKKGEIVLVDIPTERTGLLES